MEQGSYNNIVRTNSPFTPVSGTPSPSTYKANVNRTKTRKWVEAKTQNYDGDDWGNDSYDEDDDEPYDPPPPARPTGGRQPGQLGQLQATHAATFGPSSSRPFAQPAQSQGNAPPTVAGPRNMSVSAASPAPQNRTSTLPIGAGQLASRFPPRKSSMSSIGQQEGPDTATAPPPRTSSRPDSVSSNRLGPDQRSGSPAQTAGVPDAVARPPSFARPADMYRRVGEEQEKQRQSMESGRPSMESTGRNDGASSRSSLEQRRRTSLDRDDGTPRSPKPTLAPVAERKSEYGMDRMLADDQVEGGRINGGGAGLLGHGLSESNEETESRRLSISPKLPDVSRISGFGDDFFSNSGKYSSAGLGSTLQSVSENQTAPKTAVQSAGQRSSVLDGPKLEPNPNIIMPPPGAMTQEGASGNSEIPSKQAPSSRPQLPGGWVTETSVLGSEQVTPMESSRDNRRISATDANAPVPDDIEPTTKVKHLPSPNNNTESEAEGPVSRDPSPKEFGAFGHHDDGVASKALSAGPGYHPTPHSLPPLKTDGPQHLSDASRNSESKSPVKSIATDSSSRGVPQASPGNQSNTVAPTITTGFPAAAPLNSYRLSTAPSESAPDSAERQSTMSTVGTASPLKESDKLREEIMRSLSPNPMSPENSGEAAATTSADQDDVLRESRYLSGVYDDYLSLAEEKTLQETGRAIRNESMSTAQQNEAPGSTAGATTQHNPLPEVAPLSSKRTPEPEPAKLKKRFSWEQSPEPDPATAAETQPTSKVSPLELELHNRQLAGSPAENISAQSGNTAGGPTSQPEGASRPSAELPIPLDLINSPSSDHPSPISLVADEHSGGAAVGDRRRSLTEEKVLVDSSSHPMLPPSSTDHPALSRSPSPPAEGSPADTAMVSLGASATPLGQQPKIMPFKEILSLPSADQRTQKFDETRDQFFRMDSGLSNWLMHMQAQVEGADGTSAGDAQQDIKGGATQSGSQPSTQQPYYQQYLNASTPNPTMGLQRTMSGNLLGPSGSTTSGFNSGHHQVGAKGKELLHTAGAFGNKGIKSGMKLFSKGKSKLRERTGDKVKALETAERDDTDADADADAGTYHEHMSRSDRNGIVAPEPAAGDERRSSWSFQRIRFGIGALGRRSASAIASTATTATCTTNTTTTTPAVTARHRGGGHPQQQQQQHHRRNRHHQQSRSLSSLSALLKANLRNGGVDLEPENPVPRETASALPTTRDVAQSHALTGRRQLLGGQIEQAPNRRTGNPSSATSDVTATTTDDYDDVRGGPSLYDRSAISAQHFPSQNYHSPFSSSSQPHSPRATGQTRQSQPPTAARPNLACAHSDPCLNPVLGPGLGSSRRSSTCSAIDPVTSVHFLTQNQRNQQTLLSPLPPPLPPPPLPPPSPPPPPLSLAQAASWSSSLSYAHLASQPTDAADAFSAFASSSNHIPPSYADAHIPPRNPSPVSALSHPLLSPVVSAPSRNHTRSSTSSGGGIFPSSTGRCYSPQPDLVSPISEVRSLTNTTTTPPPPPSVPSIVASSSSCCDGDFLSAALDSQQATTTTATEPGPISSKYPPVWDQSSPAPLLVEEEEQQGITPRFSATTLHPFVLSSSTTINYTPITVTPGAVAHDDSRLITDETPPVWIQHDYLRSPPTPRQHQHQPPPPPQTTVPIDELPSSQLNMTAAMAAANRLPAQAPGDAAHHQNGSPVRQSSFVGLPPIRRTSTIDLLASTTGVGDDRGGSTPSPVDDHDGVPPVPPVPTGLGLHSPGSSKDHVAFHASPPRTQPPLQQQQQNPARSNGESSTQGQNQNGHGLGLSQQQQQQVPAIMQPGRGASQSVGSQPFGMAPKAQQVLLGHKQAMFGPMAGQPSAGGPPFIQQQVGGNPVQKFPPGPWKLEESHLSEPLHPSRGRSGTSPPLPQPSQWAFDKETGLSSGPPPQPLQRQKNSIPPISAQRFPGLFADPRRLPPPQHQQQHPPQIPDQAYKAEPQPPPSSSSSNAGPARAAQANDHPNDEDRRSSTSSLFFKELGGKFVRSRAGSDARAAAPPGHAESAAAAAPNGLGGSGAGNDEDQLPPPDKRRLFGSATDGPVAQPKPRSSLNMVRTAPVEPHDHAEDADPQSRKRLSDLRTFFKGHHPTAPRDDQPVKVADARPLPNASGPAASGGFQGNAGMPGQQQPQQAQQRLASPLPLGGPAQDKSSGESRFANQEDREKSVGRFFNKLLGNKSKGVQENKQHPAQQRGAPPQDPWPAAQFQPAPPNPQFARQPGPVVRPSTSDGSSPSLSPRPGAGFTHAKQLSQASIQSIAGPQRPATHKDSHPLNSHPVTPSQQPIGDGLAAAGAGMALADSPKSSPQSFKPMLSPGLEAHFPTRLSPAPNRKPVGSASVSSSSRQEERDSIADSTHSVSTVTQPNSSAESNREGSLSEQDHVSSATPREGEPAGEGERGGDESTAQSSPTRERAESGPADGAPQRPMSLPSPVHSTPPQQPIPEFSSQSRVNTSSTNSGSPQLATSAPSQQQQQQQSNQEKPAGKAGPDGQQQQQQQQQQSSRMAGALPVPNNGSSLQERRSQQQLRSVSAQSQSRPLQDDAAEPGEEPLSPMTKLLGPKTRTVIQAFPTQEKDKDKDKEKGKTSKKIFSAFKRSKQPAEAQPPKALQQQKQKPSPPQQQQQQVFQPGPQIHPAQMMARPGVPGQPGQQPQLTEAQRQAHIQAQMQAMARAHMQAGQRPMPPQMQPGRGQTPQGMAGPASPPLPTRPGQPLVAPQFPGPGQQLPSHQQQMMLRQQLQPQHAQPNRRPPPFGQKNNAPEPQYAQVPIPRGYELVRGYNTPGGVDVSPYHVGHHSANPSPTPGSQPQYVLQGQSPQPIQQFDPRSMPPQNIPPQQQPLQQPPLGPQGQQPIHFSPPLHQQQHHPSIQSLRSNSATPPVGGSDSQGSGSPAQPQQQQPPLPSNIVVQAPTPAQQVVLPADVAPPVPQPQPQQQQQQVMVNNDVPGSRPISPETYGRSESAMSFTSMDAVTRADHTHQHHPLSDLGRMSQAASGAAGQARNASLSHDGPQDRDAVVSPEPPGSSHSQSSAHHLLAQQVSMQSIKRQARIKSINSINIDAANKRGSTSASASAAGSPNSSSKENIYDATPRNASPRNQNLPSPPHHLQQQSQPAAQFQVAPPLPAPAPAPVPAPREPSPPEQQPGFYDPSNAKTANGGAAAVDDDYPDDTLRAQQPRHNVAEPEEKILVDQPAELPAAPDDDDDGIPVMSATSYPGQEWNPYGYGEFGDWD